MPNIKDKLIEELLKTTPYDDMTKEQMDLVVEYEVSIYKGKVDEYYKENGKAETEEMVHDMWLDYEIADKTEDELLRYIGSDLMKPYKAKI